MEDTFKKYYETKDKRIRKKLIFEYMPKAKELIFNYGVTTIEPDDLEQIAYETLIICIDNYSPYTKEDFLDYLTQNIEKNIKKNNKTMKKISLSNIELCSSENFEENLINKIVEEKLIETLTRLLDDYPNQKHVQIFKRMCLTSCDTIKEFAQKEKLTKTMIEYIRNCVSAYVYSNLYKEFQYYASEIIKRFIENTNIYISAFTPKIIKDELKKFEIKDLEYMTFYDPNVNTIYGDIKISKQKKLGYK